MIRALLISIVVTIFGVEGALCADHENQKQMTCQQVLFATGRDWANTHYSPKAAVHPAFSKTADKIYFYYDIPGLELFIEQGPYGGRHLGANKIHAFYINYDPQFFIPLSFHRLIFGNEPVKALIKDGDFSRYYDESMFGDNEILQIRIPLMENAEAWDLSKAIQLIVSRDTGQVYGYGRKSGNCVASFLKDCWLELRTESNARRHGYGTWYNSASGMPLPNFYQRALEQQQEGQPASGVALP